MSETTQSFIKVNRCPGGRRSGHYTDFFAVVASREGADRLVSTVRIDEGTKALKEAVIAASESRGLPIDEKLLPELGL